MSSKQASGEAILRSRIRELEEQVTSYKKRLEDLRRAKNTTILKREREVVEVGGPQLGKRGDASDLEKRLQAVHIEHEQEVDELRKRHTQELSDARKGQPQQACDHEVELQQLRSRVCDLEDEKAVVNMQNQELQDRADSLLQELSIKEATWCDMEEKLNRKLQTQWSEKYSQWMEATEKKLEELQQANTLMRTYLKKQKPNHPDDPDSPQVS